MTAIDTLKAKREEANRIVEEIKGQSKIVEENVSKSNDALKNIIIDTASSKQLNNTLKRINNNTSITIEKFKKERDAVSKLLTQVNRFYKQKYLPLYNKIEDKNTGLKVKINEVGKVRTEVIKIKKSSLEQYNEVKKQANELRKKNKELLTIDSRIRKLSDDCISKKESIGEINKSALYIESQIKKVQSSINKIYISCKDKENSISTFLEKSQNNLIEIKEIKKETNSIKNEIEQIYEIAADTGLSGEFDKRRTKLKELLERWEIKLFCATLFLLLFIIGMFILQLFLYNWDITNETFNVNFYVRFLIASPIVYYIYFCSVQYSKTKKLHDIYSFKTTLTMSIKNHLKLLTEHDKFNEKARTDKILEFILSGFDKIYAEPYNKDEYKIKLKLANIETDIEKKIFNAIEKYTGIKKEKEKN